MSAKERRGDKIELALSVCQQGGTDDRGSISYLSLSVGLIYLSVGG